MKIVSAETSIVEIPFELAGSGVGIMPTAWRSLELALVRLEDELGNEGWGEGFGYFTVDATKAVIDRLLVPTLVGSTVDDIREWNRSTQRDLHLFGRYGVTIFAISAVDVALWDLAARRAGKPLYELLTDDQGAAVRHDFACYSSLMRYADPELAASACEGALGRGYTAIKLHEVGLQEIEVCRQAIGPDIPMSVDVNCAWSRDFVTRERSKLEELKLAWLEEPVFPPEDFDELRALRSPNLPLAAGENWCTAWQFQQANGAVEILQPSVTKVGGISEYLSIVDIARSTRSPVIPHCPYFGPGFYATLHLAAAHEEIDKIEILYVEPDAWLSDVSNLRSGDRVSVPPGPGLGFEPDPDVTSRYRRA